MFGGRLVPSAVTAGWEHQIRFFFFASIFSKKLKRELCEAGFCRKKSDGHDVWLLHSAAGRAEQVGDLSYFVEGGVVDFGVVAFVYGDFGDGFYAHGGELFE